jgi:hypothetical protein
MRVAFLGSYEEASLEISRSHSPIAFIFHTRIAGSILHMLNSRVYLMKPSKLIELITEHDDLWFCFTFFKIQMSSPLQELDLLEPKQSVITSM